MLMEGTELAQMLPAEQLFALPFICIAAALLSLNLPQNTELAQVPLAEQQLKTAVDKVTRELQMLRGLQPAAMR